MAYHKPKKKKYYNTFTGKDIIGVLNDMYLRQKHLKYEEKFVIGFSGMVDPDSVWMVNEIKQSGKVIFIVRPLGKVHNAILEVINS